MQEIDDAELRRQYQEVMRTIEVGKIITVQMGSFFIMAGVDMLLRRRKMPMLVRLGALVITDQASKHALWSLMSKAEQ